MDYGAMDGSNKSANPTYGGFISGYPEYSPGYAPSSAPEAPPDYNSDAPAQIHPSPSLYPGLPPPSYEEAGWSVRSLRDAGESDHVMGIRGHFAPRYPVYHFAAS